MVYPLFVGENRILLFMQQNTNKCQNVTLELRQTDTDAVCYQTFCSPNTTSFVEAMFTSISDLWNVVMVSSGFDCKSSIVEIVEPSCAWRLFLIISK